MRALLSLAWRDLRGSGRTLWVFCACLMLGVMLIAASGGLYRQVSDSLLAQTRTLFGGDLEVRSRSPLPDPVRAWLDAHGTVSQLVELRTMLMTEAGDAQLVELQSVDARYPLVGALTLDPPLAVAAATAMQDGHHGIVIDPVLAARLALSPGDRVAVGALELTVRAITVRQPDRSLRADWRGPPVLISAAALAESGLLLPGSRPSYRYRVLTDQPPAAWRDAFVAAFPDSDAEVRSFAERNARLDEVLRQIGSGVLLIGFSALVIGGMGVFNSVQAYLQGKLGTLATLRALGLRDARLAGVYLMQMLLLAGVASLAGALLGGALALIGTAMAAARLPVVADGMALFAPLAAAWACGVAVALLFALPALGRALTVSPAALFRGALGAATHLPAQAHGLTALCAAVAAALLLAVMPDPVFGLWFLLALLAVLGLLEVLVRALRWLAKRAAAAPPLTGRLAARIALSALYRPDSSLRPTLLSLGSALTLLVAATLVVHALLRTIDDTVPQNAPTLAFYDIQQDQRAGLAALIATAPGLTRLDLAPLVLGRVTAVGDESLRDSADSGRRIEARDEHKLSTRAGNLDDVVVTRGQWWPDDYRGPPLVAMEDREADQLGLKVGDILHFDIAGNRVTAQLAAIYAQQRMQARFWLEAIFSDGALDPYLSRYIGAAWLDPDATIPTQNRIAAQMPNVVTVRTAQLLDEARAILARAATALTAVGAITLLASLLVLISVVTASRVRQVYLATVLHTLGARVRSIEHALTLEYLLLAVVTSLFASAAGGVLAHLLLTYRLELSTDNIAWSGALVATVTSVAALGLAARWLLAQLRRSPASLLRGLGG